MTTSMQDKERKQEQTRGKMVTMSRKAGVTKQATEGKGAAAATAKAAQGIEGSQNEAAETGEHKGATKALRHALKAKVKAESEQIAQTLVTKVKEGDMKGTEMVPSLIEKKKEGTDGKKKKRSGPSWAELLASEPEWDESMEDGGKKLAVVSGQ
jgi:hypothetical protein